MHLVNYNGWKERKMFNHICNMFVSFLNAGRTRRNLYKSLDILSFVRKKLVFQQLQIKSEMISFNISILFLIILIGIGVQSIHFPEHVVDNYGHPKYKFDYTVSDPHTGDHKHQWEHRDGGHVQGAYSFLESDGTTRIVEYKSAPHIGFHAKIRKIGHATHPHPHEYQHHF